MLKWTCSKYGAGPWWMLPALAHCVLALTALRCIGVLQGVRLQDGCGQRAVSPYAVLTPGIKPSSSVEEAEGPAEGRFTLSRRCHAIGGVMANLRRSRGQ